MMRFPQTLRRRMANFRDNENGSGALELVLLVPVLTVITFGLITYVSAFQAKTHATRTATVVADMVSRETNPITPAYLDGIEGLMDTMIHGDDDPEYRLTAFIWHEKKGEYRVKWSKWNGDQGKLNHVGLNEVADRLPTLKDRQRAILLETWIDHDPISHIGLEDDIVFENFLVAAPRFVPQLCWMNEEDGNPEDANC